MDIQGIVSSITSGSALNEMAAKIGLSPEEAQNTLHGVLAHVTGGGSPEELVASVAAKTGIDPAQVQQFLPSIMGLLQGHAEANAPEGADGAQAGLGGLLGSLGGAAQGGPAGGLMGMVSGLFGKKS